MSFSTYYLPDNTSNGMNINSYAMAFNREVYNAPVIYVITPSIWVLIDLPLPADFLPAHPSDCFTIDLPNVPVAGAAVGEGVPEMRTVW